MRAPYGTYSGEELIFPRGTFDSYDDPEPERPELVVEYAYTEKDARAAAHAVEINCGGRAEIRPATDGGWLVVRL